MHIFLQLSSDGGMGVLVRLNKKDVKERIVFLLENNRSREAFDLLKNEAQVEGYFPIGAEPPRVPHITLVEDLVM